MVIERTQVIVNHIGVAQSLVLHFLRISIWPDLFGRYNLAGIWSQLICIWPQLLHHWPWLWNSLWISAFCDCSHCFRIQKVTWSCWLHLRIFWSRSRFFHSRSLILRSLNRSDWLWLWLCSSLLCHSSCLLFHLIFPPDFLHKWFRVSQVEFLDLWLLLFSRIHRVFSFLTIDNWLLGDFSVLTPFEYFCRVISLPLNFGCFRHEIDSWIRSGVGWCSRRLGLLLHFNGVLCLRLFCFGLLLCFRDAFERRLDQIVFLLEHLLVLL